MSASPKATCRSVLLVDADFRTAQCLAGLLRDDGFEVEVARDGAAAIARLARAPLPDALVSELRLPVADGAAVARFGRAQHPGMRVVFVARDPNLLSAATLGNPPPEVLTKPIDYARLRELLKASTFPQLEEAPLAAIGGAGS